MKYADIVLIHGQVITVNSQNDIAEGLAICKNKILYVGTKYDLEKFIGPSTKIINLYGRTLLPGFIDAHLHLSDSAASNLDINCNYPNVKSIEDIKKLIKEATLKTPKGQWIRAFGYNENKLIEKRHPTKWDLDAIAPNHPVVIARVCMHMGVYNSKALDLMQISNESQCPKYGEIVKQNGKITGLLKEQSFFSSQSFWSYSTNELIYSFTKCSNEFSKHGITSVHDAGGAGKNQLKALQHAYVNGQFKTRIYAMIHSFFSSNEDYINDFLNTGLYSGFGNEHIKIGAIKVAIIDGSSSSRTSALIDSYTSFPEEKGKILISQDELNEICLKAHIAGNQITAHAVGDKAIEMFIGAIENALSIYPRKNHRHRIEHATISNPELIDRIKQLGMIPIVQPKLISDFGETYLNDFGKERCQYIFPCKSYIENGIIFAGSSDWSVTNMNPILGIHAAITRDSIDSETFASQKISVMDAIRMYTYNGAYASFEEKIKGSLEEGKLADMVILSESILTCDIEKIKDIKVDMTIIDGEIAFDRFSS